MTEMKRVVVLGSRGSGKTTVARAIAERLGVPPPGDGQRVPSSWARQRSPRGLSANSRQLHVGRAVDSGRQLHQSRDHGRRLAKADTFVWLDVSRRLAMWHVTRRALRRTIMRQEPWPGVREPISNLYSLDPRRNIMARTWTRHAHVRQKYETARAGGSWGHATVFRLTTPTDVARFLDSLTGAQN